MMMTCIHDILDKARSQTIWISQDAVSASCTQNGVLYLPHKNCLIVPHTQTQLMRNGFGDWAVPLQQSGSTTRFNKPVVRIFPTPRRPRKKERTPPPNMSGRRRLCSDMRRVFSQ